MQWTKDKGVDILSSRGRDSKTDSCWPNPLHLNNLLTKLSISMWPLFLMCLKSSRRCHSWFWQDLGHPLWVQGLDSLLNTFLLFLHFFQLQAPILPPPKQKMVLHSLLLARNTHSLGYFSSLPLLSRILLAQKANTKIPSFSQSNSLQQPFWAQLQIHTVKCYLP